MNFLCPIFLSFQYNVKDTGHKKFIVRIFVIFNIKLYLNSVSDKYIKLSDINYSLTIFVSRKSIGIHPEMLWKAVESRIPQVGKYLLPHGRAESSWACPVMPSTDCQSFKSSNKVSLELPSQGGTIKRKRCFSPTYTVAIFLGGCGFIAWVILQQPEEFI